nr:MAG TPA: hypothetical protein [Caudoviricetes sp.]
MGRARKTHPRGRSRHPRPPQRTSSRTERLGNWPVTSSKSR